LGGTMTHEIVAVFSDDQVAKLRKVKPDVNPKLFVSEADQANDEGGIVFEAESEDEVDVDDI
jgi:hypothetical protein